MYRNNKNPMCNWNDDSFSEDDRKKTRKVRERSGSTGSEERITYYPDGSSIRHGGGPTGDTHYNDIGEEC
jgi:hypothetical protein